MKDCICFESDAFATRQFRAISQADRILPVTFERETAIGIFDQRRVMTTDFAGA
jgi:hypothetical protein